MGNPNAKVKLVEFGSMTCPHCAEFEEQGGKTLIDNYVKNGPGQLRIPQLRPRSLRHDRLADRPLRRAEAASSGLTRACYADQRDWVGKTPGRADRPSMQALQTMPPAQHFSTIADARRACSSGRRMRGVPRPRADAVPGQSGTRSTSWSR